MRQARHAASDHGLSRDSRHAKFLAEVEHRPQLHAEIIDWFLTLPLWFDLPGFRVVHACWHQIFMDWLEPKLRVGRRLSRDLMVETTAEPVDRAEKDTAVPSVFKAVEALTKGLEIPLPDGRSFLDRDGHERRRVRVRWWDDAAITYRSAAMLAPDEANQLQDAPVPAHARVTLPDGPVLFGHYWLTGTPSLLGRQCACVDYSAAKGGPLVAYRFHGEVELTPEHLVWVG